jgi:hypothetical protein
MMKYPNALAEIVIYTVSMERALWPPSVPNDARANINAVERLSDESIES